MFKCIVSYITFISFSFLKDADTSITVEPEEIEKLGETNSDIKGRLSEAMRENSKHMVDPDRKVNGQPVPAQQPTLFTGGVMRWYQVEGIEWLRVRGVHQQVAAQLHKKLQSSNYTFDHVCTFHHLSDALTMSVCK